MENENITVIVPDYLDKPLNEEEEKEFFSDLENEKLENEELENDFVSTSDFEKLYDEYLYQKSLNDYNAIVEQQNAVNSNYLNQIANCTLYTMAFVGAFFLFYLLSLIVKFFRSLLDF